MIAVDASDFASEIPTHPSYMHHAEIGKRGRKHSETKQSDARNEHDKRHPKRLSRTMNHSHHHHHRERPKEGNKYSHSNPNPRPACSFSTPVIHLSVPRAPIQITEPPRFFLRPSLRLKCGLSACFLAWLHGGGLIGAAGCEMMCMPSAKQRAEGG